MLEIILAAITILVAPVAIAAIIQFEMNMSDVVYLDPETDVETRSTRVFGIELEVKQ